MPSIQQRASCIGLAALATSSLTFAGTTPEISRQVTVRARANAPGATPGGIDGLSSFQSGSFTATRSIGATALAPVLGNATASQVSDASSSLAGVSLSGSFFANSNANGLLTQANSGSGVGEAGSGAGIVVNLRWDTLYSYSLDGLLSVNYEQALSGNSGLFSSYATASAGLYRDTALVGSGVPQYEAIDQLVNPESVLAQTGLTQDVWAQRRSFAGQVLSTTAGQVAGGKHLLSVGINTISRAFVDLTSPVSGSASATQVSLALQPVRQLSSAIAAGSEDWAIAGGGAGVVGGVTVRMVDIASAGSLGVSYTSALAGDLAGLGVAPLPASLGVSDLTAVQAWTVSSTAAFTGAVTVNFGYAPEPLVFGSDPGSIRLLHWVNGFWVSESPELLADGTFSLQTNRLGTFYLVPAPGTGGALLVLVVAARRRRPAPGAGASAR